MQIKPFGWGEVYRRFRLRDVLSHHKLKKSARQLLWESNLTVGDGATQPAIHYP